MAYFGENWDDNVFPLAYLITIRTFGTWLHGDEMSSVDTHHGFNIRGAERRSANPKLAQRMAENMKTPPVILDRHQRAAVKNAIEEVCTTRGYYLMALNVRTNHAHAVVTAQVKPEFIANSFKSYATRELRRSFLMSRDKPVGKGTK